MKTIWFNLWVFLFSKPVAVFLYWKQQPEIAVCIVANLTGVLLCIKGGWIGMKTLGVTWTELSNRCPVVVHPSVGSYLALLCNSPHLFLFLNVRAFSSTITTLWNIVDFPVHFWTMQQTLHFRIWNRFCDVKPCAAEGNKVCIIFTHNDWGEQKWAQSWKREGPGETAPAASVRPKWTFKDWTGLCWDTRVSLGEFS